VSCACLVVGAILFAFSLAHARSHTHARTRTRRLVKDIVTETETFNVETFIPLLQKYIRRTNPYIRQLLVGWITVLDGVPDICMVDWLPDFLEGLFNMLSDGNREIRQAADRWVGGAFFCSLFFL